MDLLLLGKEPVSVDQPAGTEIRYDPSFDELQAEIDKLSSPSAAGAVDWTKVVKMSSEILSGKSKDLLVASYLALALIYANQHDGLSTGLRIYRDLLNNFWEDLFPPKTRMRGRLRAIEWWIEKTEAALGQLKQDSFQADQLNTIKEDLEEIDHFFSEHLEEPFSFASIRDFLNSLAVQSEEAPQESKSPLMENKEAVASPRVAEKVEEIKKADIYDDISSQKDAQRTLDEGLQKLRKAAAFLWQQDLTNPIAYRFSRISAWSSLDDLPPATNDRTRILPPNTQIRNILYELKNKGDNEALLKSAEERFSQFVFWLDLNRLISESLNNLGSLYQKAHEVVCQETAFLIYRLPGLEGLCFSDGTPFADPETKQWLKEIVLRPGSSAMDFSIVQEPVTVADDGNLLEKEIGECRSLIKKGRLLDAVERLQSRLRNSFSQRDKLLWRIALSQVLMGANQVGLALPHLEQIINEIALYKLEEYDPLIAIKGLKLAWFAFDSRSDQASKGKAAEALQRIATLDLCEVIRLGKGEVKKNK